MSEQKKQDAPTPEDSPILMTGYAYGTIATAVVQVWDPYGEVWRGLWRRTAGTPRKAWLEDKETKTKDITCWEKLLNVVPAEKGQRIGVPGMTRDTPRADAPAVHFDQGGPGALDVPASSLFQKESGLQYPQRVLGADS